MSDGSLNERIRSDLNTARRARDRERTVTLSTFLSEARNREIELGRPATDEDLLALLTTAVKRRREAAEQMRSGGREELAAKEERESALLREYLPAPLTAEEVRGMIEGARAAGASDVGGVMKVVMPLARGRFDGRELNRLVREALDA
jgi:uncharacterized protein